MQVIDSLSLRIVQLLQENEILRNKIVQLEQAAKEKAEKEPVKPGKETGK